MGQTASQIENHIDNQREDLSSNLRELEYKVKTATDWHYHFENRPMVFLGVAFGGGVLLAKFLRGNNGQNDRRYSNGNGSSVGRDYSAPSSRASNKPHVSGSPSHAMGEARDAWENIKGALVGIAATRLKEYVDEVVPGFSEQYQQAETEHDVRARA